MSKNLIAILTADIHLRETQPICRKDNYWEAQENAIKFISSLRNKDDEYTVPFLDAGDLFHKTKEASETSNYLNAWAIKNMPNNFVTIPGNHDLIDHSIRLLNKTNLTVLEAAGNIEILNHNVHPDVNYNIVVYGVPYCTMLPEIKINERYKNYKKILLIHTMIFENADHNKFIEGFTAKELLKKYPQFDLVVSGHNHKTFVVEYQGRKLVNPGSMMIMAADQKKHKPCVFKLYDDFSIEQVFISQNDIIFDKEHIVKAKEKDERIEKFIDKIEIGKEVTVDFKQNIENFLIKNKSKQGVTKIIWENVK